MSVNYPMTALNVGGFYPSHAINGGKMRYKGDIRDRYVAP